MNKIADAMSRYPMVTDSTMAQKGKRQALITLLRALSKETRKAKDVWFHHNEKIDSMAMAKELQDWRNASGIWAPNGSKMAPIGPKNDRDRIEE